LYKNWITNLQTYSVLGISMSEESYANNSKSKKLVLITGSAKRLGAATALKFAESGYDVIIHYNNSKGEAENIVKKIKQLGAKAVMIKADLTTELDIFVSDVIFKLTNILVILFRK